VNVINNLTLTTDINVPVGVALIVKNGKTLTVDSGKTLALTGGGLVLDNGATLTVEGTVNAKASTSPTSFGIVLMLPTGATVNATIKGSGTIHLKTRGTLLAISDGQKLILDGTITLDGLRAVADGGTDGDAMNNIGHVVFVAGELDMKGGTITGNYNISTSSDGGGVEVNGGNAKLTMSGSAEVSGNRTSKGGGGVNVVHGGTFIMEGSAKISGNIAALGGGGVRLNKGSYSKAIFTMKGNAEISGNTTDGKGGGVWVRDGGTFTMEGGTIYGSTGAVDANTASDGVSLYVDPDYEYTGSAEWGAATTTREIGGVSSGLQGGNIISSGDAEDATIHAVSP
jgi:hypothetical protein